MMRGVLAALALVPLLGGCGGPWNEDSDRIETAREFPPADRPFAAQESRDRDGDAEGAPL